MLKRKSKLIINRMMKLNAQQELKFTKRNESEVDNVYEKKNKFSLSIYDETCHVLLRNVLVKMFNKL